MSFKKPTSGRVKAVAAGAAVLAIAGAGAGGAVAASQITTNQIKDGTIQTRDLTKNNFARFTSTENVASATTLANPALSNAQLVTVPPGNAPVPLVQLVLDKGTYKITGTAQFRHQGGNTATDDYGVVTVGGLQNSLGSFYTDMVPDGGTPAQTSFQGTVTITASNTPVVVYGTITGSNPGQAAASIQATQFHYVKLFNGGAKK